MDRRAKCLGLLGAYGIGGEAYKIVDSQAKLLGKITLVFILPLALKHYIIAKILLTEIIPYVSFEELKLPLKELLLLESAYPLLSSPILMAYMAVYTVANHKPSLAGVMKVVPTVLKRMMITCLWYFIIDFLILMAFVFACCLLALGLVLLGESYAVALFIALFIVWVVLSGISLHVEMVWKVASVVSVMEEEYNGLEGMRRSRRLLEGKRSRRAISISYLLIIWFLGDTAFKGYVYVVRLWARIGFRIDCVLIWGVVALMGMISLGVLYFVCKAHQYGESIDGNLGEYEAVNKDVESVHPLNN